MVSTTSCFVILCFLLFVVETHHTKSHNCQIKKFRSIGQHEKHITIQCGGSTFKVGLVDRTKESALKIVGSKDKHLLSVQFHKGSKDISLTIDGKKFVIKDGKPKNEEEDKFKHLVTESEFTAFLSDGIKLIHDELKLKGWKSPAVGFLYRLGIAAVKQRIAKGEVISLEKRRNVDLRVYLYHGPDAVKKCMHHGYSTLTDAEFTSQGCPGLCGMGCTCWKWVCGDCCQHPGCNRHDKYCHHFLSLDCLTGRGVIWDDKNKTAFDC